ncbi:hypothetical protein ONE63_003737 [Megalurothrips usitatus]|uniref:RRM domain-containing protein n=1 Tax=Megalurothrips usitatus TaxID=439358 RepID=A0AAV7X3Y3_9NEOP|nr:hypothetical protein ONE63_003737 [Megalurothrips usitatus]
MDDPGPKTGGMASNGSARSPGRGGSRGRGGGFRGDRGGRGRGNFRGGRGRGNFRGGDRSGSRGRGKFSGNDRGSGRGSLRGNEGGSVRGSFRGGDRSSVGERGGFRGGDGNSFRGRGNFRGGDKSPFRGRGRGRGRGNFRGGRGRGGFAQKNRKSSESAQEGSNSEQEDSDSEQEEGTDSEQEGIGNPDTVEIKNEGSLMDSEDSVVKPKTPKKANKKKPAKEKQERVRLPYIQLLPGQAKKAVQFSNLPSLFNEFNDELKKFAETVGPVELLTYNRFPHPKGCFITALCVYEDKEHVAKAIEKLHGREFRGNHLLVERPSPKNSIRLDKKSVCVSNLSEKTTEEDLWKYFKECGSIRTIEIRRDCSSLVPENLGLARIYFNDSDSLDRAVALSNSQLLGSTIKVFSLSCDLVVYVKNFALQTKYKTIKDFMTAVNAVYYCFVYLKSRHMKEKLKGLFFYFPDQESYHNVVSMENFQEIPAKMQKLMGCSGSLSFGTKQIFKGVAGNNQKVAVKEEHSDKNESDSADEKEEVVQDAKKKSKKNKKLSKALSNVQNESDASDKTIEVVQNPQKKLKKNKKPTKAPSNGAAKELKAFRKRKGSEVSNTSPIKKNRIVVKAEN